MRRNTPPPSKSAILRSKMRFSSVCLSMWFMLENHVIFPCIFIHTGSYPSSYTPGDKYQIYCYSWGPFSFSMFFIPLAQCVCALVRPMASPGSVVRLVQPITYLVFLSRTLNLVSRIHLFSALRWEAHPDPWVLSIIQFGYKIEFSTVSPLGPTHRVTYCRSQGIQTRARP